LKNLGINTRVILLGTLPAILFALILAGYAIFNVFALLDKSLLDRGTSLATQLAPATEYGVVSGNVQVLQQLVQKTLSNDEELTSVIVTNAQGQVLALSGRELSAESLNHAKQSQTPQLNANGTIIFTEPIFRSLVEVDDFTVSSSNVSNLNQAEIGRVYIAMTKRGLYQLKVDLITRIVLIALFGLGLSALIAWQIGRNIAKPIQELAYAINRVSEGAFTHTVSESSSGELRVLQKGFNSMSESLREAYSHMQEKVQEATSLLRHQARHDDLTNLINRREFEVRLEHALKEVHEQFAQYVFCYLDLDQFKLVNDTCGHTAGDELLRQVSALLANRMREQDTLARLGGDEFGLLIANCTIIEATQITDMILKMVGEYRFIHDDKIFGIGLSIGIVALNHGYDSISEVIHAGDTACYSAKKAGRNQSFIFSPKDADVAQRQLSVAAISDITDEISDSQFILYCQPIIALSGGLSGQKHFEVLIRKIDHEGKLMLPTTFIPSAERYHIMPNIDRWVIKSTFAAYRRLLNASKQTCDYVFSINLSGTSLSDKSLLGYIREQFAIHAIPPQNICFEITETSAIVNLQNTIQIFKALRAIGCKFALDDFGSGMSSFTYLKNFEVDFLKIDGSFVKEMHLNKMDHAMVRSVHSVAEAMGIQTVAEFVENETIVKELKKIGIHYGQGLHLGVPITMKKLIENYSVITS
jgi:diguanylate cyclase (GGDEF)-like protein